MLSLTKIKNGHHGSLLVLWWVALQDLLDQFVVLLGELEGSAGIVLGTVTVLYKNPMSAIEAFESIHLSFLANPTHLQPLHRSAGGVVDRVDLRLGGHHCQPLRNQQMSDIAVAKL